MSEGDSDQLWNFWSRYIDIEQNGSKTKSFTNERHFKMEKGLINQKDVTMKYISTPKNRVHIYIYNVKTDKLKRNKPFNGNGWILHHHTLTMDITRKANIKKEVEDFNSTVTQLDQQTSVENFHDRL